MDFPILFADESLLVIYKPYGVVVNRAESVKGETVQDWMERKFKVQSSRLQTPGVSATGGQAKFKVEDKDFYDRSGVVHRLDKETSGCLILAKSPEAFSKLQAAFKNHLVKKTYVALVHGEIPVEGEINAPVGRLPWNRESFGVVPGGKDAVTKYKVIKRFRSSVGDVILASRRRVQNLLQFHSEQADSGVAYAPQNDKRETFSLVELYPQTGRTHQIRVHLKYLGYPIVGDYLYAGRKVQKADRVWCPRVFLHAAKIEFPHPQTGKIITVTAPMSVELVEVLNQLDSI